MFVSFGKSYAGTECAAYTVLSAFYKLNAIFYILQLCPVSVIITLNRQENVELCQK